MKTTDPYCAELHYDSWKELRTRLDELTLGPSPQRWIFRGQADAGWALSTTLERCAPNLSITEAESLVFDQFITQAHLHLTHVPPEDQKLEWLSLMQHHGAPTRLLDWTFSPYVATYFAFEEAKLDIEVGNPGMRAIWALNLHRCIDSVRKRLEIIDANDEIAESSFSEPAMFTRVFLQDMVDVIAPVSPRRHNNRFAAQQGLFLCCSNRVLVFTSTLRNTFGPDEVSRTVLRISVPGSLRPEVLRHLQEMNINRGTLFPDLDGFAQSLRLKLELYARMGHLERRLRRFQL